jgi:hypothetical protein
MLNTNQSFAYAYFGGETAAAQGVQKLIDRGFGPEHIGVLMRRESVVQDVPLEHKTGVKPGAAIGSGSVLGLAIGAAALPATPVIAVGGAFATLGGAAVGGAAGTLMGALGGLYRLTIPRPTAPPPASPPHVTPGKPGEPPPADPPRQPAPPRDPLRKESPPPAPPPEK